jgi:hypothetical protein
MTRPRRLYTTADGKFYYLIDGKKKFVKVPAGISQKQVAKINIRNIVNAPTTKRIKRRRKRIEPAYGKKVGSTLAQSNTGGLPIYFFKPKKQIPTLQDQAEASADTTVDKLTKAILKLVPSSSKIPPTLAIEDKKVEPTALVSPQTFTNIAVQGETPREMGFKIGGFVSTGTPVGASPEPVMLTERLLQPKGVIKPEPKKPPTTGGGDGDGGLYNDEIEKIVKKRIKNYVPVIASDEINQLPRYVARGDKRFGFVINTNPSTSDGSGNDGYRTGHWRAVYINNDDDYPSVEYFDPLAEGKMPPELITICRKIAIKMNPSMMFKYKQNMLRRQSKVTSTCGHHAIKFLDDRFNGVPWSEATGYDDYMEKHSSPPDDSHDGEKDIAKTIKKYESYI